MKQSAINLRHQVFAETFLTTRNGTLSAIRAGYSEKSAHSMASQLLANRKVRAIIENLRASQSDKFEVTRAKVIGELARLGFSNMLDYVMFDDKGRPSIDLTGISRGQGAAIQEITVEDTEGGGTRTKLKLSNKREALELLGRHLKLFDEAGQVNVGVKVIMVDIPRPDRTPELPEDVPTE